MSGDEQLPAVHAVGHERVEPVKRWYRRRRYARGEEQAEQLRPREEPAPAPQPDRRENLASELEHAQLEHPLTPPREVDVAASVHDAAQHGDPIARAIEQAHRPRRDDDAPSR